MWEASVHGGVWGPWEPAPEKRKDGFCCHLAVTVPLGYRHRALLSRLPKGSCSGGSARVKGAALGARVSALTQGVVVTGWALMWDCPGLQPYSL